MGDDHKYHAFGVIGISACTFAMYKFCSVVWKLFKGVLHHDEVQVAQARAADTAPPGKFQTIFVQPILGAIPGFLSTILCTVAGFSRTRLPGESRDQWTKILL